MVSLIFRCSLSTALSCRFGRDSTSVVLSGFLKFQVFLKLHLQLTFDLPSHTDIHIYFIFWATLKLSGKKTLASDLKMFEIAVMT